MRSLHSHLHRAALLTGFCELRHRIVALSSFSIDRFRHREILPKAAVRYLCSDILCSADGDTSRRNDLAVVVLRASVS
jgi:hypothetical protein